MFNAVFGAVGEVTLLVRIAFVGIIVLIVFAVVQWRELAAVKKVIGRVLLQLEEERDDNGLSWESAPWASGAPHASGVAYAPAQGPYVASTAPAYVAPAAAPASAPAVPAAMPDQMPVSHAGPATRPPASVQSEPAPAAQPKASVESWVGRNALGVVASILVFLGLVFLGITVAPALTDTMKVCVLFTLSGALTAAGAALCSYRKNGFTSAVMGCGMGSLFISVFITHLYFNMIGDVAAFSLVLAWMALCLVLIRRTDSLLLAVVLQLGLAISVCLGYYGDSDGSRLALLIGYQIAASLIVVVGNVLVYRRMYRPSLVLALALSLVASVFMWRCFGMGNVLKWVLDGSLPQMVAAFIVQFASATALAAMLAASALGKGLWLGTASGQQGQAASSADQGGRGVRAGFAQQGSLSAPLLVVTACLWICVVALDVYWVVGTCANSLLDSGDALHRATLLASCAACLVVAASSAALSLFARSLGMMGPNAPEGSWFGSAASIVLVVGGASFACAPAIMIPFSPGAMPVVLMWAWALVTALLGGLADRRAHRIAALVFVALETAYLCLRGLQLVSERLDALPAAVVGAAYVLLVACLGFWLMRELKDKSARYVGFAAVCTALAMSYLHNCTALVEEGYVWSICCMACALVCVVAGFKSGVGGLRLYGLILTLCCVAKLVIFDISGLDSLARVGAFIAGGLICFAMSALYNFAVRRLQSDGAGVDETC